MKQNHFGKGDNIGGNKVININKARIKWLIPVLAMIGLIVVFGNDKLLFGIGQLESKVSRVEVMVNESTQLIAELKKKNEELKEEIQKTNLILQGQNDASTKITEHRNIPSGGGFSSSQSILMMLVGRKHELSTLIISTRTIIIKNKMKALNSSSQDEIDDINDIITKLEKNVSQLESQLFSVEKEIQRIQDEIDKNIQDSFRRMG